MAQQSQKNERNGLRIRIDRRMSKYRCGAGPLESGNCVKSAFQCSEESSPGVPCPTRYWHHDLLKD
eukprot:1927219-Amphidinium_carterae.1